MIQEDYVSFETAKLLNEKGFNELTLAYAYGNDMISYYSRPRITDPLSIEAGRIPMPTLQMAMKWLRLTHKIYIQAFAPVYDMDCAELGVTYNVIITNLANQCLAFDTPLDDIEYNSPEEAHEAALKYCLKNLI